MLSSHPQNISIENSRIFVRSMSMIPLMMEAIREFSRTESGESY